MLTVLWLLALLLLSRSTSASSAGPSASSATWGRPRGGRRRCRSPPPRVPVRRPPAAAGHGKACLRVSPSAAAAAAGAGTALYRRPACWCRRAEKAEKTKPGEVYVDHRAGCPPLYISRGVTQLHAVTSAGLDCRFSSLADVGSLLLASRPGRVGLRRFRISSGANIAVAVTLPQHRDKA